MQKFFINDANFLIIQTTAIVDEKSAADEVFANVLIMKQTLDELKTLIMKTIWA